MEKFTEKEALDYHSQGKPGKIEIMQMKLLTVLQKLEIVLEV